MLLELPAGIGDDRMGTILVDLGQDGTKTSRFPVQPEAGVGDERKFSILSGIVNHWF